MIERLDSSKDLKKLIRENWWDIRAIQEIVRWIVVANPWAIIRAPEARTYLTAEERKVAALKILDDSDNQWLRNAHNLRNLVADDTLRDRILKLYIKSPWLVQTQSWSIKELFPNEFFQRILEENGDFPDSKYFELFLLFNAHHDLQSYWWALRQALERRTENLSQVDVSLCWFREPGFACWWMERNYMEAAKTGNGICLVNNTLLAKYFHRKWDAKKVSYLPVKTYTANNWYILWKDYFYSPSQKQHEMVIQAIEEGKKSIQIEHLSLKSVRPANSMTSQDIVSQLPKEFTDNFL